jgi:transposase
MQRNKPEIVEVDVGELEALLERAEQKAFETEDYETIRAVLESYFYVTNLIDQKSTTLARLRKLLFGARTEKTAEVIGQQGEASGVGEAGEPSAQSATAEVEREQQAAASDASRSKRKGHGRNGADDYPGAIRVEVPHKSLQSGDACPECLRGTVYEAASPGVLIRFVGQAPVQATVYQLQKLRCGLCGQLFTAEPPAGIGVEKYDATAGSMIALLKYGSGMPFHRLDGLQENLGIPLPASTQWDIVHAKAERIEPAFDELTRQAADGDVVHNDDTTIKILELMDQRARQEALAEDSTEDSAKQKPSERSGMFTTGIVSTREGRRIALFFSGRKHAGENLKELLLRRAANLPAPIQMCDALSRNLPAGLATILAHCLAHGRRQFVDVADRFPEECQQVLEPLSVIYRNDAIARERNLSPEARLLFHQAESGPIMEELQAWLGRQIDQRRVEPNSALGGAISYLLKHWVKLTLFLRVAGAPLDNNICERALKKAILHRKNALFYKTCHGAHVGDMFMSLIYTCEFCGANPFDYLTELERHAGELSANPQNWMPWNYRETLEGMGDVQTPSGESRQDDQYGAQAAQGTGETDERRTA